LPIIPGQGDRDVGNWKPVVGNIGRFGLEAGWSLSGFARTLAGRFTSLDVQLLSLLALLGTLTLIWNQSPGRRPRNYQSGDRETNFSHLNTASDEGVAITCDDSIATIDVDDLEAPEVFDEAESLDTSSANEAAEVEGSSGQDVDLITQAEVYLAYGRHKQAIEVLLEEYDRPDSDRFVAASHLIKAYRKMGETSERNASLEQFIDTINRDIERFSSEEWDSLSNGLDELGQDDKCLAMQDSTSILHPAFRRSRLNGDEGGAELTYDSGALAPLRKTLP
jgi:tetratricopeptide (TPR) repeat protein